MASVVDINNCNSNENSKDDCNPFEQLQPALRSQEDEIRKGIFSRALRLLSTATDDEKLRWRHAIMEAITARESGLQENKKKKLAKTNEGDRSAVFASAAVKRPREGNDVEESDRGEEKKMTPEGVKVEGQKTGDRVERDSGITENNGYIQQEPSAEQQLSDTEYIAAFLRTLLDKVVGLSLLELHVDALRVLCIMLGIPLPKSRSKMTLYSTLASFHYTHCEKLGKRVPSSNKLQAQVKRDEEMMRKILSKGHISHTTSTTTKSAAKSSSATTRTTTIDKKDKKNSGALLITVNNNTSSLTAAMREPRRKSTAHATLQKSNKLPVEMGICTQTESQELEVQHHVKVFADAAATRRLPVMTHEDNNQEEEEGEWSMVQLERKVASVVQLYDPVTSAVVVKKLTQMGYRKPCATETVEAILRSFHQRELVFYDNGIAYLL